MPGRPLYRVGSDGSIWKTVRGEWQMIRGHNTGHGYVQIGFHVPGTRRTTEKKYVHSLVMESFVGPRPTGFQVCHKNGDGRDNRLENLYYGTPQQNSDDKARHGTQVKGDSHPMRKLSSDEVLRIVAMLDTMTDSEIGEIFGVHRRAIKDIRRGARWSHVTGRGKGSGRSYLMGSRSRTELIGGRRYPKPLRLLLADAILSVGNKCQSCGLFCSRHMEHESDRAMEIDHKDPRDGNYIENFQFICRKCNRLKGNSISPDVVIGEWLDNSAALLVERLDRLQAMLANPGWSVQCP